VLRDLIPALPALILLTAIAQRCKKKLSQNLGDARAPPCTCLRAPMRKTKVGVFLLKHSVDGLLRRTVGKVDFWTSNFRPYLDSSTFRRQNL